MTTVEHVNVARVRAFAAEHGVEIEIRRFPASTRTAQDAAREIGVEVGRIVKSLVFLAAARPLVVLCCGDRRVSEERLREAIGANAVRRATADEAKRLTGYAIGGVPPFAHETACEIVIDERMSRFETVWAAAGLPDAVFEIAVADLRRLADARPARVAVD
ncbi:MAG TPA: YbaK/EbsC family protein [Candidatus Limnocylindria bacterium]|nr:YbaK/EbsC family protein [Candidatus Limnocylindria bacterium]